MAPCQAPPSVCLISLSNGKFTNGRTTGHRVQVYWFNSWPRSGLGTHFTSFHEDTRFGTCRSESRVAVGFVSTRTLGQPASATLVSSSHSPPWPICTPGHRSKCPHSQTHPRRRTTWPERWQYHHRSAFSRPRPPKIGRSYSSGEAEGMRCNEKRGWLIYFAEVNSNSRWEDRCKVYWLIYPKI